MHEVIEIIASAAEHAELMQGVEGDLPRQDTLIVAMGLIARSLRDAEWKARQAAICPMMILKHSSPMCVCWPIKR